MMIRIFVLVFVITGFAPSSKVVDERFEVFAGHAIYVFEIESKCSPLSNVELFTLQKTFTLELVNSAYACSLQNTTLPYTALLSIDRISMCRVQNIAGKLSDPCSSRVYSYEGECISGECKLPLTRLFVEDTNEGKIFLPIDHELREFQSQSMFEGLSANHQFVEALQINANLTALKIFNSGKVSATEEYKNGLNIIENFIVSGGPEIDIIFNKLLDSYPNDVDNLEALLKLAIDHHRIQIAEVLLRRGAPTQKVCKTIHEGAISFLELLNCK